MLSGFPVEFYWNCDASEAIVFNDDLCFLTEAILKASPKPWVDITRNIDGRCSDKIVPADVSISEPRYVIVVLVLTTT